MDRISILDRPSTSLTSNRTSGLPPLVRTLAPRSGFGSAHSPPPGLNASSVALPPVSLSRSPSPLSLGHSAASHTVRI
eukprot:scaffold682390_cov52-Prasinocladus_malaysianus.AAC.1